MNIFVIGLENRVINRIFYNLLVKGRIKIVASLSTNKIQNIKIPYQFIESKIYQNSFENNSRLKSLSNKIYTKNKNILRELLRRVNLVSMNEKEIKNFYINRISFFIYFFKNNKIKSSFFDSTPHFPIQYIIFLVSKYFKNKCIILHRTDISNLYLLKSSISPKNKYEFIIKNDINKNLINKYFSKKGTSIWQMRSLELNERSKKLNKYKFFMAKYIFLTIFIKILFEEIFQKSKSTPSIFFLKKFSLIKRIYLKSLFVLKYQRISNFIRNNSVRPNLKEKFVYFGLHFQPERSTLPEGGVFADQIKAIYILSKSVDSDTHIYVKEHPRQVDLYPDLRRLNFRNINYYKKILKLKNVSLVDTYYSSDLLLKNSTINSTITGSIGSDSIKNKKPVILFSDSWYSESKFCKVVKNISDCKLALKYFSNKFSFDDSIFIKNLSKNTIKTNIYNFSNQYAKNNYKQFLEAVSKIL